MAEDRERRLASLMQGSRPDLDSSQRISFLRCPREASRAIRQSQENRFSCRPARGAAAVPSPLPPPAVARAPHAAFRPACQPIACDNFQGSCGERIPAWHSTKAPWPTEPCAYCEGLSRLSSFEHCRARWSDACQGVPHRSLPRSSRPRALKRMDPGAGPFEPNLRFDKALVTAHGCVGPGCTNAGGVHPPKEPLQLPETSGWHQLSNQSDVRKRVE